LPAAAGIETVDRVVDLVDAHAIVEDRIELVFLQPYVPESNPDEYLNRALRTAPVSHDKASLLEKATAFLNRLAAMPEHVMRYFRHPAAAYAARGI
jgi:hypothetical protein